MNHRGRLPRHCWKVCLAAAWVLTISLSAARAQTGAESNVGYIDDAIPANQVRLRTDAGSGVNRPDRAEFFWAPYGPPNPENNVNFQEITAMVEMKLADRFSAFIDVPVRFIQPSENADAGGLSDIDFGFKWAVLYEPDQVLTFQLRTYVPTGDVNTGLSNGHVTAEPSLLLFEKLSERLTLEGELGRWIPIGGTSQAGTIIEYGLGLSYHLFDAAGVRVTPVVEVMGWTVLNGKQAVFPSDNIISAAGDTIVNGKFGVRFASATEGTGLLNDSDLYVGYGRPFTGDVWYTDIVRIEYRLRF